MTEYLPAPWHLAAIGTALLVGAGLVMWFLHLIRVALIMAALGFVMLFASSVAYGYEKLGEEKIRPQLEAAQAELRTLAMKAEQFRTEALTAQQAVTKALKEKSVLLAKLSAKTKELLDAQNKAVSLAAVPEPVVVFLNTIAADVNAATAGPGADEAARAAAASPAAVTFRQLEEWNAVVAQQYGECSTRLIALQDYVGAVFAAGQRAASR